MAVIKNMAEQDLLFVPYRDDGRHVGIGAAWMRGGEPVISPNYARYVNYDSVNHLNFVLAVFFIDSEHPTQAGFSASISAKGVGVSVSFRTQSPACDLILAKDSLAVVYYESGELKIKLDPGELSTVIV